MEEGWEQYVWILHLREIAWMYNPIGLSSPIHIKVYGYKTFFFLCDAPTVCMTTLDAQAGSIGYRFVRGDHRDEFVQTPSAAHMSRAPNVDSHTRRARLGRLSQRPYRRWSYS